MQHSQPQIPQQASLKPRSIITLPHLIGRQKPVSPKAQALSSQQQQQYAITKAPIIIRERLDPNVVTTALPESTQHSTTPTVSYTSTTDLTTATTTLSNSRPSSSS